MLIQGVPDLYNTLTAPEHLVPTYKKTQAILGLISGIALSVPHPGALVLGVALQAISTLITLVVGEPTKIMREGPITATSLRTILRDELGDFKRKSLVLEYTTMMRVLDRMNTQIDSYDTCQDRPNCTTITEPYQFYAVHRRRGPRTAEHVEAVGHADERAPN